MESTSSRQRAMQRAHEAAAPAARRERERKDSDDRVAFVGFGESHGRSARSRRAAQKSRLRRHVGEAGG